MAISICIYIIWHQQQYILYKNLISGSKMQIPFYICIISHQQQSILYLNLKLAAKCQYQFVSNIRHNDFRHPQSFVKLKPLPLDFETAWTWELLPEREKKPGPNAETCMHALHVFTSVSLFKIRFSKVFFTLCLFVKILLAPATRHSLTLCVIMRIFSFTIAFA